MEQVSSCWLFLPFSTTHVYVWRNKERKGVRLLLPLPSSLCDVSGHWGHNCRHLSFWLSRATHMRRNIPLKDGCLPAGRGFHWSLPLLTFSSTRPASEADSQLASRQSRKASRGKYTQNTRLRVSHNLLYESYPNQRAQLPISTAEQTNNMAAFVLCWMFHDHYFLVLLLVRFPDDGSM